MRQEFGERKEPTGFLPLVDCDLSGKHPVGEDELRALEILLGESLRQLLSAGTKVPMGSASHNPDRHTVPVAGTRRSKS